MKKLIGVLIIGIFLMSSVTSGEVKIFHEVKKAEEVLSLSFNFSEPSFLEKMGYINVEIAEGDSFLRSPGKPMLPLKTVTINFPLGIKVKSVECIPDATKNITLTKKVIPAPGLHPLNKNQCSGLKEERIYESKEEYPSKWITWRTGAGVKDGKHVTFLTIYISPTRYKPLENVIEYASHMKIKIFYEKTPFSLSADEYDFLLISPPSYKKIMQKFIEHKEKYGIKSIWVSTQQIYKGSYFPVQGRDKAEKIKYFIKNAIEQWGIKYVLLVGGIGRVPTRKIYTYEGSEEYFLSDLYYADVFYPDGSFSSWDSNENSYFGEYNHSGNNDVMDLYPDVYVGRLACRSILEASLVINKIISYEDMAKGDWFKRMIVVGGDSFNDSVWGTDYYEGEITVEKSLEYMEDFTPVRILGSDGSLSTENIINEFNEGAGFIDFEGHGNYLSWATHPPHDYNTWIGLSVSDLYDIHNKEKLPIVIFGGCHISELGRFYECLSWRVVRKADGGAISSIGFTSLSWGADDDVNGNGKPDIIEYASGYIDTLFFKKYGKEGIDVLGMAFGDAIAEYLNTCPVEWNNAFLDIWDCKTVSSWILYGDPSLKIGGYGEGSGN